MTTSQRALSGLVKNNYFGGLQRNVTADRPSTRPSKNTANYQLLRRPGSPGFLSELLPMKQRPFLETDITYLNGVGPRRAELLGKEINIRSFGDLLYYFPYRYIDKRRIYTISEIDSSLPAIQIAGVIDDYRIEGSGRAKRLTARLSDNTGSIRLVWFRGINWIPGTYSAGRRYLIFGKPGVFGGTYNIVHPEIEDLTDNPPSKSEKIEARYSTTEKLRNNFVTSKVIGKMIKAVIGKLPGKLEETLPDHLISDLKLMSLHEAVTQIHTPDSNGDIERARRRLKFEELFYIQLNMLRIRSHRKRKVKGFRFTRVGDNLNNFYSHNIPFPLTGAQKRVIKEIRSDMGSGFQMNRLLQGDVGSGKTVVALMTMLIASDNGFQSCLMAPTEILARQHYRNIADLLKGIDINIALLTGSTRKREREAILAGVADSSIGIIVGTHALIEERVVFKNLGFVVIDEQHRFGVAQRGRLWSKSETPPHVLVMTATPIPRTLAMTLYGDLDVSVIDQLPPGRKSIKTMHYYDSSREVVYGFMRKRISEGRQVFVVYPLINESEKLDYKALEEGIEIVESYFPPPEYRIGIVHGKMKSKDKELSMKLFREGQVDILIATTVIEVGVDIPNATTMIIESAERFGLSQLHQLRGRVGRGDQQSYCILVSSHKAGAEATKRIEVLVSTNDGFSISEADMRLRGHGNIDGTQQSGIPFNLKVADIVRDGQMVEYSRRVAEEVIDDDPELEMEKNRVLIQQIKRLFGKSRSWRMIS